MNRQTDRKSLANLLQEVFEKSEEVQFAYLYGSVATKTQTRASDIDVAVYLWPAPTSDFIRIEEELAVSLMIKLHHSRVDLRVLNTLPFPLQYRVLKDGVLVFSRNESERVNFETQVMIRFFELKPHLEEYRRMLSSKIRGSL